MPRYRILSLDGGGIRGIVQAILIERLNSNVPGWLSRVDLFAGTSTGGVLALALARGLDPADIRRLYEETGPRIFDDTWADDLRDFGKVLGAQYQSRNLLRELKSVFGGDTLGRLRKRVLVTTFDLDNEEKNPRRRRWKPKLFHNFPGRDTDRDVLAYRLAAYACAAPTYFPSIDGYVDGGLYANNPSMCALAQSQDTRYLRRPPSVRDVTLLSLGTGTSLRCIRGKSLDWGYLQWARPLIEIMMDGVSGIADYQCEKLLGKNYHRMAPVFPPGTAVPMDAVRRIPELVAFADSIDIRGATGWLRKRWLK
jgi:patatin-like phospholipase/acyl hydrolase